jgi:hypothetical protein
VGNNVSLQVAILKVLDSYPDGRASREALKADLALLAGTGLDWVKSLKLLAARIPDLDIFGQKLVLQDSEGWKLTDAGRNALQVMQGAKPEAAAAAPAPSAAPPRLAIVARGSSSDHSTQSITRRIRVAERRKAHRTI